MSSCLITVLERRLATISGAGVGLLFGGNLALFLFLGKELMPMLQEESMALLEQSIDLSIRVPGAAAKLPVVGSSVEMTGRTEKGEFIAYIY